VLGRGAAVLATGALAACAPQVVKETVVVEKEKVVEKVVKETVVVAGTPQVVEKVITAAAPTKAAVAPFELRIHTRVGTDLDQYFTTVLGEFKQIVPQATVKIEAVPGSALDYAAKVLVLQAGGQIGGNCSDLQSRVAKTG
jgi:hypothetical protein